MVTHALEVDVNGVVSLVGVHTAWGDNVLASDVFGPVYTSTAMWRGWTSSRLNPA